MTETSSPYVAPRAVDSIRDCHFYHAMDVPGHGPVDGEWDLRGREHDYLGHVELAGKRVLEIGPASGQLSFFMEGAGAEVVALDISPDFEFDVVPYARYDHRSEIARMREHIGQINNSFWFAHRAHASRVKVVYASVYDVPAEIGAFDIATVGSVLIHLRDPFLALQNACSLAREHVVVTERTVAWPFRIPFRIAPRLGQLLVFRPSARDCEPKAIWWWLSPQVVQRMIGVLGFENSVVTHHRQRFRGQWVTLHTVVGRRTHGAASGS